MPEERATEKLEERRKERERKEKEKKKEGVEREGSERNMSLRSKLVPYRPRDPKDKHLRPGSRNCKL